MSLARRLTLLLVGLIGACASCAGLVFYDSIRRSLEVALLERLDARLDWLESAIDVGSDIRLSSAGEPAGAAEYWEVSRSDGSTLWRSPEPPGGTPLAGRSRAVAFHYRSDDEEPVPLERLPRSVHRAVEEHLPGFVPRRAHAVVSARRPLYRLDGPLAGLPYEVDIELLTSGVVSRVDARARTGGEPGAPAGGASSGGASSGGEPSGGGQEVDVAVEDLPAAVRATLGRLAAGLRIDNVERVGDREGVVYRIDAEAADLAVDLDIAAAGTLLQKEIDVDAIDGEIPLDEVPEPVRAAILRELGRADVGITTKLRGGTLVYEAGAEVHGREVEINVREDGTLRHTYVEIDAADLPEPVARRVREALGDLPLEEVRRFTSGGTVMYEVESEAGQKRVALQLAGDGTPVDRDAGDVFPRHRLPGGEGDLELRLQAWTSSAEMAAGLARLARSLLVVGPLALLACGVVLALLMRWQLRPLERMARQAGGIGPANLTERIGPVGTSEECVRLREAINSMIERLGEGLERERRFAASAAHELRTPIAQLKTATEVALLRERDAGHYREVLRENLDDVNRLEKLVTGLLELARRRDAPVARERPASLCAVVERAVRAHEGVSCPPALAAENVLVEGDEDLLAAALANVTENARRHAPGAPPSIALEADGDRVRLVVADRGPGVPAADRERIFEPLARLDGASPRGEAARGFGLGLAVARSTLRAFGGDILCRDRRDGETGAEFVLVLRRAAPAGGAAPAASGLPPD